MSGPCASLEGEMLAQAVRVCKTSGLGDGPSGRSDSTVYKLGQGMTS